MNALAQTLFAGLRAMDAEATTTINNHPAGLYGYRLHRNDKRKKYEDIWSERLAELTSLAGYPCKCQIAYPGQSRKKCDLVVTIPSGALWIEVKPAWKGWYDRKTARVVTKNQFFSPYLFGPLKPGLSKSHSAAQDLGKLSQLRPPHAAAVALLLICFDSVDNKIDPDISEFEKLARIEQDGWESISGHSWPDPACSTCRISCRFWFRDL